MPKLILCFVLLFFFGRGIHLHERPRGVRSHMGHGHASVTVWEEGAPDARRDILNKTAAEALSAAWDMKPLPFDFDALYALGASALCEDAVWHTNILSDWYGRDAIIEYAATGFGEVNGFVYPESNRASRAGIWADDVYVKSKAPLPVYITIAGLNLSFSDGGSEETLRFRQGGASTCILEINTTLSELYTRLLKVAPQPISPNLCQDIQAECNGTSEENCFENGGQCMSDVFPFQDSETCENYYRSLPLKCAATGKAYFGNSLGCRYIHSMLTEFAPGTHCVHTGPYSDEKCKVEDCPGDEYCLDTFCVITAVCSLQDSFYGFGMKCETQWWKIPYNLKEFAMSALLLASSAFSMMSR